MTFGVSRAAPPSKQLNVIFEGVSGDGGAPLRKQIRRVYLIGGEKRAAQSKQLNMISEGVSRFAAKQAAKST